MESPTSNLVARDFQVTGVSRSGRVRKKSSKLLDFESPEEIEKRTRRHSTSRPAARYTSRGRPPNILRDADLDQEMLLFDHNVSENETTLAPGPAPTAAAVILNSDDELDNLVQDLVDGVQAEATNNESPSVRQSLYMREKASKRKVVTAKVQRKDRGKQRYTAYSLWARDVRKRELQDMDFASATRRLSELWANVSNREKNGWRRKAKVQATRARSREKTGPNSSSTPPTNQQPTSNGSSALEPAHNETIFQNRATTSRTRKLAADRQQSSLESAAAVAATASTSQRRSISTRSGRGSGSAQVETDVASRSSKTAAQQLEAPPQPTSIDAIDAAAHLKLLGESLTVIGERLKKHNGHVALSGSLSVLLDSLLCSMGPLLCMTTQIPGLENKAQLSRNLANTLDNIAYVMPGL
ncbi:HMG box-containing protein 4 [Drosophila serrata]|uniref:HMG box-containing protein 4 n=1 Tax=Drosophila serrata TaxID=7274 RepID=UPI000A1D281A|nr:HMG box-containing protein 4 [Drosophila serrata]